MKQKEDYAKGLYLQEVSERFSKHRKLKGRKRSNYAYELKALAVKGFSLGYKGLPIARAAGVTCKTIFDWKKALKPSLIPRPQELKLVPSRRELSKKKSKQNNGAIKKKTVVLIPTAARLVFPSGVVIEADIKFLMGEGYEFLQKMGGLK